MNAKTMAAILEHMDAKSVRICMLDEKLRKADEMFRQWKTLLGFDAKMAGPEIEEAIKRMSFERTTLETNYKQHVELVNALATCPLPRDAAESNQAYALRVGEALRDAKLQWEHDQRRIAQLENRESELTELQQIVETRDAHIAQLEESASSLASALTLLGTMHDGELANEFVSRMADEKKRFTLQLDLIAKVIEQLPDSMRMKHGETYETCLRRIQKSHVALDEKCCAQQASIQLLTEKHNALHATNDALRKQRDAWMDGKYLVHFEPGLHGLSWAVVDKGVVTEFSPLAAGANMCGLRAPRPEIGLWFTRVVHQPSPGQREMVEVDMPIFIRAIENAYAATSTVDLQAECARLVSALESERAKGELLTGQRHLVEGELSLHQQVIARLMMQPGTDKVFDLDWNDSARKVLIDARALCGDVSEANAVTNEQA